MTGSQPGTTHDPRQEAQTVEALIDAYGNSIDELHRAGARHEGRCEHDIAAARAALLAGIERDKDEACRMKDARIDWTVADNATKAIRIADLERRLAEATAENERLRIDVKMHRENTDHQHDRALEYMRERDAARAQLAAAKEENGRATVRSAADIVEIRTLLKECDELKAQLSKYKGEGQGLGDPDYF